MLVRKLAEIGLLGGTALALFIVLVFELLDLPLGLAFVLVVALEVRSHPLLYQVLVALSFCFVCSHGAVLLCVFELLFQVCQIHSGKFYNSNLTQIIILFI